MFRNIAYARDRHLPGEVGQYPEHQEIVRLSERRHECEQNELHQVLRPDPRPERLDPLAECLPRLSQRAHELCLALLEAGLSGEIADHLAPKAFPRDGKFGGEAKIGIVGLLRAAMMDEMIMAIGDHLAEN